MQTACLACLFFPGPSGLIGYGIILLRHAGLGMDVGREKEGRKKKKKKI